MGSCWTKTEEFFERFDPNEYIERAMGGLGYLVGSWPKISLALVLAMTITFSSFIYNFEAEKDIFDLWTPTNDPAHKERKFIDEYWSNNDYGLTALAATGKDNEDIMAEEYLQEWFELHLMLKRELPRKVYRFTDRLGEEREVVWKMYPEGFYPVQSLDWISNRSGEYVERWAAEVVPFCRPFANSPLEAQFQMPCFALNIMDCFAEGGYNFPYEDYLAKTFFASLLKVNPYMFKPSYKGMTTVELGSTFGPSCISPLGRGIPSNYIYGGEKRIDKNDDQSALTQIKGYETILYIDSAFNIRKKQLILQKQCTYTAFFSIDCPTPSDKEIDKAFDFKDDWLAKFIDTMEDITKKWNKKSNKKRKLDVTFWTSRSGRDLLVDASKADFGLLAIAYVVMIIFAGLTALRPKDLFFSRSEASACGVVLVLMAVFATMGLGATFWKFSPNVIQVLPFIALGFGVDDMFVLLFSFHFRADAEVREMMESTVRIAGSSVALTSTANLCAFAIASTMVLPDVARFALFGILMVCINFVTVLIGFTAMLSLVATRMKGGYNDWAWCCCFAEFSKAAEIRSEKPPTHDASLFDPLFDFLTRDDIRIMAVCVFFGLAGVGIYGSTLIKVGLPLAEIVPEGSYASDFLAVREDYFHSYIMTIYSDAKLDKYKSIDWPNQFYDFYNASNTIYDISKLVYSDPKTHSMWAWGFQEYLQELYQDFFTGSYALEETFVVPREEEFFRSSQCEGDRQKYCPAIFAAYGYGTDLWNCLQYNYAALSEECTGYIDRTTPPASTFTIAKQVKVVTSDDDDVAGVYSAPSTDTTNVYYRASDNAALFQRYDLTWALLDSENNLMYYSESTTPNSQPPQGDWYSPDGEPAALTVVYYDLTYFYAGARRGPEFKLADEPTRTSFGFRAVPESSTDNDALCLGMEVMQKSMATTTAFGRVEISSSGDSSVCDAVLDSTEICLALASEDDIGSVGCGRLETVDTLKTDFYVGKCTDTFTIAASDDPPDDATGDLTASDACYCTDGTDVNDYTLNVVSPCGGSNYGGFGLDTSGTPRCNRGSSAVTVQCDAVGGCSNLEVCYEDIEQQTDPSCDDNRITNYASTGTASVIANCLLRTYGNNETDLTECCKQATRENFIYVYSCDQLQFRSDSNEEVCSIVDQCDDSCNQICYGDVTTDLAVIADCDAEILESCYSFYEPPGDSDGLVTCLEALPELTDCCSSSLAADKVTYDGCLVPQLTYWDYGAEAYVFDDCSNTDVNDRGCGAAYTGSETQRDCMVAAYDDIPDGCCKRAVGMIGVSYIFTKDCEGDTYRFCDGESAMEASDSCVANMTSGRYALSENCNVTLSYCTATGDWTLTKRGETATADCDDGYAGTKSRTCVYGMYGAQWAAEDLSGCSIESCPENVDSEGQVWPATEVGLVASFIGFKEVAVGWYFDGVSLCGATQIPYITRLCSTADDGTPEWREPFFQCRNWFTSAPERSEGKENTICATSDFDQFVGVFLPPSPANFRSNLILAIPEYLFANTDDWFETCQDACDLAFTRCQGFYIFNKSESASPIYSTILTEGRMCFLFDWCEPFTASSLFSQPDEFYWYDQKLSIAEFVAALCAASHAEVTTSNAYSSEGIPVAECFNMTMWQYLVDPLGGVLNQDRFIINDRSYLFDNSGLFLLQLVATTSSVNFRGIDDDADGVEFIEDFRDHLDKYFNKKKLHSVPGGLVIDLYSQYIGVEGYLVLNLAFVSIAVVGTGLVFLLHPVAVGVVLLCDAVMIIEVYGFSDWAGLRINGVMALNLVIAIGLTMEFTAHMARAFMIASAGDGEKIGIPQAGPGQIRMKKCLREMFTPVSLGAITTFLGVAPISAAQFPYFRQYYFVLYVLIVMFGWVNGVIFLPIIMSILNPKFCGKTSEEEHHGIHHDAHLEMVKSTSQYTTQSKEDSKEKGLVEAEPVTSGTMDTQEGGEDTS